MKPFLRGLAQKFSAVASKADFRDNIWCRWASYSPGHKGGPPISRKQQHLWHLLSENVAR